MHKNNNKKQETLKWLCHSQHVPEKANEFKDISQSVSLSRLFLFLFQFLLNNKSTHIEDSNLS